jgi:Rad3-related DNA helicase
MTYNLPHPLDRPGQQEAFDWLMASDKKFNIICGPTGSGKSAWVAEASKQYRTLVLTQHKSLQDSNYKSQYGFDILYGKSNYRCENPKNKRFWYTAYDCNIPQCDCSYQQQERHCLSSPRVSLNYAKFLLSKQFVKGLEPQILFLDEAHNLPEIITEFIGFSLRWDNEFIDRKQIPYETEPLNYAEAMNYLRQCAKSVRQNQPDKKEDLKQWRKWKRLNDKISSINKIVGYSEPLDWFYEVDDQRLTIKPLTAKYHFKKLFEIYQMAMMKDVKIVLMSATIKPSIASRLGLDEGEFAYYEMDNAWPTPSRLIYNLSTPNMNYESTEDCRQEQAKLIASVLKPDKSGIIHVSSKVQAYELVTRLSDCSILHFWCPTNGIGTDKQLQEWYESRYSGLYCISWNFHEGVDLGDDDINILAKVPYTSLKSNYEKAKQEYDPGWYNERTAYAVEQACGRIRRGKPEHYKPGAKMIYLADGGWKRLKPWLSNDFKRTIRNWNGSVK